MQFSIKTMFKVLTGLAGTLAFFVAIGFENFPVALSLLALFIIFVVLPGLIIDQQIEEYLYRNRERPDDKSDLMP